MVGLNTTNKICILILFVALLFVMPSAALNASIYGDTAGFNPDLHKENFTVVYSLPGSSGTDLDTNITKYTDPSVDVIFMGGDDSFSPATASLIEQAVASGKILVVSNKNYQKFNSSLPATSNGSVPDGQYLVISDPNTTLSKTIFNGLRTNFPNTDPFSSRFSIKAKEGSVTLLSYDMGDPALLYRQYGNGYVIEWAPVSNTRYLNSTEADLVNYRLITLLANEKLPGTLPTTAVTTPKVSVSVQPDSGNIAVFSSPPGAAILIDGDYQGTTPANISGVLSGYHFLSLTLSGYYNYDSKVYVVAGKDTRIFGTLNPVNQFSTAPTPVPTTAPPIIVQVPVTAEPTQSQAPLENPGVIAAIIGVITATIGAIATIFSHIFKAKKD